MKKITAWLLAAALSFGSVPSYAASADRYDFGLTENSGAKMLESEAAGQQLYEETEKPQAPKETESAAETEPASESESAAETESVPGTENGSETGTETENGTEVETETEIGTETENGTEMETETETEMEAETELETETETETVFEKNGAESGIDWDQIDVPEDAKGAVEVIVGNALPLEKEVELNILGR